MMKNDTIRSGREQRTRPLARLVLQAVTPMTILVLLLCADRAGAVLFDVELIDNDGPHILGQVNSNTDELTVSSWTENPGGINFWTPSDLPRTYLATSSTGAAFDVPNDWNGTIDSTWGFIALNTLPGSGWNEGSFTTVTPQIHGGWGAQQTGAILITVNTEVTWRAIPVGTNSGNHAAFDTVSVQRVPEPCSLLLAGVGLVLLLRRIRG